MVYNHVVCKLNFKTIAVIMYVCMISILQDFEFDVEAASQLRLTCYNNRGRLLGDELSGKVTIDVSFFDIIN